MASIEHTRPIPVGLRPVPSERKRRQRRHRWLKAVILLTVPFYCVGFSMLALVRVEAMLNRAASSPMFLGGIVLFAFLLLMEPFTGVMTHSTAAAAKGAAVGIADPVSCLSIVGGCLTVIGVVSGAVAFMAWLL
ncbi:MAG: hypothetical protein MAG451_01582 [Anaerolineales bacterium]|nr:hypothetical protein [Anaerolineales bacterium]